MSKTSQPSPPPIIIERAEHLGYCYGVERAFKLAESTAANSDEKVYTLGPLIHNQQATDYLAREHGVKAIDAVPAGMEGKVVIRSHGVAPQLTDNLEARGIEYVDATCPFVKRIHQAVQELQDEGYLAVVIGERNHPEVQGIMGYAHGEAIVVEQPEDLEQVPRDRRLGIVIQTTQNFDKAMTLIGRMLQYTKEVKVHNPICYATDLMQSAAIDLARRVDVMVVVGGKHSGNTQRLAQLCDEQGARAYHIETEDELQLDWFQEISKVGVTAGASTPDFIIDRVYDRLRVLCDEASASAIPA